MTVKRAMQKIFLIQQWILLIFFLPVIVMVQGCTNQSPEGFQGYAEGEFVYLSSPLGGLLEQLAVQKGETVQKGKILFSLEKTFEQLDVKHALQVLNQAENSLADLKKGLRPSELDAIRARLRQAELSLRLADTEYKRRSVLFSKEAISKEDMDRVFTLYEQQKEQARLINAELATAGLGAREDAIRASEAFVESLRARQAQAQWRLSQKTVTAPETGLIFDTFHKEGEYVPPGSPVLSLLPPGNIKIRFFVPETEVAGFKTGEPVAIFFDGAQSPVNARISYISPRVEYTPPVIYSSKSRTKLVFMLEAVPEDRQSALLLHPGQPVDVDRMNESEK